MLTQYHTAFLKHLVTHKVPFLIIGGQARELHFGIPTSDLDVVVDHRGSEDELTAAIVQWVERYPKHVMNPQAYQPPFDFERKIQIHFPEADVYFQNDEGEYLPVPANSGIDVLIGMDDLDFDAAMHRSVVPFLSNQSFRFLAKADVPQRKPQ